jgi:hypothetical protein
MIGAGKPTTLFEDALGLPISIVDDLEDLADASEGGVAAFRVSGGIGCKSG